MEHRAGFSSPRRRWGIPAGRILGFPLHLSWTVLLLAVLVTVLYGQFGGYLVGFGFVVCLLGSVLLHELGHAVTARRFGIGVRGITLEILGGYTEMTRDAPTARVELLVALAGPLVSLGLGIAAAAGTWLLPVGTGLHQVVLLVALANIIVAFFNMLPGLPLDGGRVLRAAVWAGSGSQLRGTLVAARSGQLIGLGTAVGAVGLYVAGIFTEFGLILMLLVAFVLWQGASASAAAARVQQRVPLIDVDQLARPLFLVPSGTPLAEAQRQVTAAGRQQDAWAVTDSSGSLVALVNRKALESVPDKRRPWVSIDSVARDVSSLRRVDAGLRGSEALAVLQSAPAGEYLVTSHDRVVGVLWMKDVARLLRAGSPGQARGGGNGEARR